MDRQAVIEELKIIIEKYLKENNLELVDLIYRNEGRDLMLRVIADRPEGGITMDDCAQLNRDLGNVLDQKNILQEKYILEVASPGLDRPLKSKNDFTRCLNKKVKFFLNDFINGKLEWDGVIMRTDDESVYADIEGIIVEISYGKIAKAKQVI
ncbi:MAG: ribosome maturation factor RimP [Candidatus Omnitrophota bacterium]|jgi:ribosome maturation factor RimP